MLEPELNCGQFFLRARQFQSSVPHHVTGAFTSHRKFLDDKEYGEALDCLVKACSDLLLQSPDGQRIFIGKRLVHPQPDWWFVGGRIFPGETPVQSCCRLLKRELALEIDPARFQTVCCQSLAWGMRQQPPMEHGTTDSQVCGQCDVCLVCTASACAWHG